MPPPEGAPSQQLDHHQDVETRQSLRNSALEGNALPSNSAQPRPASKSAFSGRLPLACLEHCVED
jgi:hypothetical protein